MQTAQNSEEEANDWRLRFDWELIRCSRRSGNLKKVILNLYIGTTVTILGFFILFSRKMKFRFSLLRMMALGVVGAFNKGISGSGFGPIVTTGGLLAGLDEKATVSIQSLSELFASIVGFLTFVLTRTQIELNLTLAMVIGVALSSPLAAFIVHKMPAEKLRWLIGLPAIVLGSITLVRLVI